MNNSALQQFRNQLAEWIELRISSGQLPFRRLETNVSVMTGEGLCAADMLLWINRDSLLAGSTILFPERSQSKVLEKGAALAEALGLGHFVTWGARDIIIWGTSCTPPVALDIIPVPAADQIVPNDFQRLLDELLARLKLTTVTTAVPPEALPPLYYLNLCRCTLQDLMPDLTEQVKLAAGKEQTDSWVEQKPLETAWLSIWRLLYLLWAGRLPPGLLPERLEQAMKYALSDLDKHPLNLLRDTQNETLIGDKVAVRLNHLAGRLKQLHWPRQPEQANELFDLLLVELARDKALGLPKIPWAPKPPALLVNVHMGKLPCCRTLVAPRAYLAGWALKNVTTDASEPSSLHTAIPDLRVMDDVSSIVAQATEQHPPSQQERQRILIALRQVWPNRRFELPRQTPACIWQALHLLGVQNFPADLTLILPENWQQVIGADILWRAIAERYQLLSICISEGRQIIQLGPLTEKSAIVQIYRKDMTLEVPASYLQEHAAGLSLIYLNAAHDVVKLLLERRLGPIDLKFPEGSETLTGGVWLFINSSLGRHLWATCSPEVPKPERESVLEQVRERCLPLPDKAILEALDILDLQMDHHLPEQEKLDRKIYQLLGSKPDLQMPTQALHGTDKPRRPSTRELVESIASEVFQDGVPRFPENYLMSYYRPTLQQFEIPGPLTVADSFFERTLLVDTEGTTFEVEGPNMASALLLASHTGRTQVDLPVVETINEAIVAAFRADLRDLWERLVRRCRRHASERKAALQLARRIWRNHGLPSPVLFEKSAKE